MSDFDPRPTATLRRSLQFGACSVAALSLLLASASPVSAETLFGPQRYTKVPGPASVFHEMFMVPIPTAPTYLILRNGNANGTSRLDSIAVDVNGLKAVAIGDVTADSFEAVVLITEQLLGSPGADNLLSITLSDEAEGFVTVEVASARNAASPPPSPVLSALPAVTTEQTIRVHGMATEAITVEVYGPSSAFPAGPLSIPANQGAFVIDLPLAMNMANRLTFTSISSSSLRSAPVCAMVTHDARPPWLAIDLPTDAEEVASPMVDVAGRVGDFLSGFMDLTVTVNGVEADVDVGIGTNGTFFAPDVPLEPEGTPTVIDVVATDAVGNASSAQITVNRVEIPPASAQIRVMSGNGQTAPVGSVIAEPIVVQLVDGAGQPLCNKLVEFEVTRSDGRLGHDPKAASSMKLQVRADVNGMAQAFWRLGSDAGCGNNRVRVTSRDLLGSAVFCASAAPAAARKVLVGMGANQRVEAGGQALEALRAWVTDDLNPAPNVPVTYTVMQGNGRVNGLSQVTVLSDRTGHAQVTFVAGSRAGVNVVEATVPGSSEVPARFTIMGLERDVARPTSFVGQVIDNRGVAVEGASVELVVEGTIVGPVETNADGIFELPDVPAGMAHLVVDGNSAFAAGGEPVPASSFPRLEFEATVIPNVVNQLPEPVKLPYLSAGHRRSYSQTEDTILEIEGLPGVRMTIAAGSMFINGMPAAEGTAVALNKVDINDIPMPMPDGAAPAFGWTLQPGGAVFDPPVAVELPNSSGLPPGATMYFLSFDHDTLRFEIVATGRVSADGATMVTDPGSGLTHAGWGGACPPYGDNTQYDGDADGTGAEEDGQDPNEEPSNESRNPNEPVDDPCEGGNSDKGDTDPVHYFSGEFYLEETDLSIRGRGLDFTWARKYRSKLGPNTRQGNGWDCVYDIRLVQLSSRQIRLHNGWSRADVYTGIPEEDPQGSIVYNTFRRRGFFTHLMRNPDQSFSMVFANKGRWDFHPFDGSPSAGKLAAIVDRNGNQLAFAYDGTGLLTTITDTLGRPIALAYNADGFIESVTDFSGRQVRYEYYQDGDSGGSFGDLKSVTTPAVMGTPNGNDFPAGKTTTYTYTTGFADEDLNHNLLTVTDPKGQTYVTNVYAATADRNDLLFDRVVRQIWGNPGDIVDITYSDDIVFADGRYEGNRTAVVNDRVGNVTLYKYDWRNRLVEKIDYTGRADPDQPTILAAGAAVNPPLNPLRPDDPPFYLTRYEWNEQSLLTSVVFPNGNQLVQIYEGDLIADRRERWEKQPTLGNLRFRIRKPGRSGVDPWPGLADADQEILVEEFEYDTAFGGCCGFNFVTRYVDPRGNSTLYEYDDRGNRTKAIHRIPYIVEDFEYNQFGQLTARVHPDNGSGHRRRDEYTYYDTGPQLGYLQSTVVDATGEALTTTVDYDAVGNPTSVTDPKGNDTQYLYNQLDQLVRRISREVDPGGGVRYERDYYYDGNDNLVRVDVQNRDADGVLQANTHFTRLFSYEILNNEIARAQEVGDVQLDPSVLGVAGIPAGVRDQFIVTEYTYDANRNRTGEKYGEATNGNQPANTKTMLYDERELLFRVTRAEGDADQSTDQIDYDGNGHPIAFRLGLEQDPRVYRRSYDGLDRLKSRTDPMGNTRRLTYDPNGNLIRTVVEGELLDAPGDVSNVLLRQIDWQFDAMDRRIVRDNAFFEADTGTSISDGVARESYTWTDNSQVGSITDDNDHRTDFSYDTVNRLMRLVDARGNSYLNSFDDNSNVMAILETALSDIGGPTEQFTTTFDYDGLNRARIITDSVGNVRSILFDSRGNPAKVVDALGNVTRRDFDGASRHVRTANVLTDTGTGAGVVVSEIVNRQVWDNSSRLVEQIDDNDNATRYTYDPLDRVIGETSADLTAKFFSYDVHDNVIRMTDANGSQVASMYDLRNRVTRRDIVPGPGVSGDTTFEVFAYDGISRLVRAEDDDSIVLRNYDSLSNILTETQNGQTIRASFDGEGNRLSSTYPGGRRITRQFDSLDRLRNVLDQAGVVAIYDYVGADRVARRTSGNDIRTSYTYDGISGIPNPTGDFGVKRVIRTTHTHVPTSTIIDDRAYTWDAMYNKTSRTNLLPGGVEHRYTYDSVYRLVHSEVIDPPLPRAFVGQSGWPGSGVVGLLSQVRLSGRGLSDLARHMLRKQRGPRSRGSTAVDYDYDGVGNRLAVTGGSEPGNYMLDSTMPAPADWQMNQYTQTPFDTREYDENGNLARLDGSGAASPTLVTFDYRNQMVAYEDQHTGVTSTYKYDALKRRIEKTVDDGTPETTRYFYEGWRVCEEQDDLGATLATYVYGNYIDEVLNMRRDGQDHYYHGDDMHNVMALTDHNGVPVERYEYGDFGESLDPLTRQPVAGPLSTVGNPYGFTGRRLDEESAWYFHRTRYYEPRTGRFVSRDSIGTWGDVLNRGNASTLVNNNPWTLSDPTGRFAGVGVVGGTVVATPPATSAAAASGAAAAAVGVGAGVAAFAVGGAAAVACSFSDECMGAVMELVEEMTAPEDPGPPEPDLDPDNLPTDPDIQPWEDDEYPTTEEDDNDTTDVDEDADTDQQDREPTEEDDAEPTREEDTEPTREEDTQPTREEETVPTREDDNEDTKPWFYPPDAPTEPCNDPTDIDRSWDKPIEIPPWETGPNK